VPARLSAGTLSYLGYRAGSAVALALPDKLAEPAARLGARLMMAAMGGRRRMMGRHLQRVHGPGASSDEVRRAVAAAFDSYARYWLEVFRLPRETPASLEARFDHVGLEHLDGALAGGRGVILAAPHLGNWDMAGAWLATRYHRPAAVAEIVEPPELFQWFMALREAIGVEIVPLGDGVAGAMVRILGENRIVGLICDRDLGRRGVEVEFFGEVTTLPGGPATLALRTGAPILPAAAYLLAGGRHRMVFRPPLDTTRQGRVAEDVTRITQALAGELESLVRAATDQWHLMQPNWPSDYGDKVAVECG
jgi:phosphatidylinositol dimannoside acyltransferase